MTASHIINSLLTCFDRSACTVKYRTSVFLVRTSLAKLARTVLRNLSPIFHGTDLTLGQYNPLIFQKHFRAEQEQLNINLRPLAFFLTPIKAPTSLLIRSKKRNEIDLKTGLKKKFEFSFN